MGELRHKIVIEADDSQVERTSTSIDNMSRAFVGLRSVAGGTASLLRGNATGMVDLAVGARVLWTALSSLNIYVKVAAVAFAVLGPVVSKVISHFRKSEDVENFTQKLKRLGLIASDLEKLERVMRRNADALKANAENADAAADAYERMLQAQKNVASARVGIEREKLDLEERRALSDPNLSTADRRGIQADFEKRRVNMDTEKRITDIDDKRDTLGLEQRRLSAERSAESEKDAHAESLMRTSAYDVLATINDAVKGGAKANAKAYLQFNDKLKSGDYAGALAIDPKYMFQKIPKTSAVNNMYSSAIPKETEDPVKKIAPAWEHALDLLSKHQIRMSGKAAREANYSTRDAAFNKESVSLFNQRGELLALAEKRKSAIDQELDVANAKDTSPAKAAEGRYLYDKADPEMQLEYLNKKLKQLTGDLSPDQRRTRVDILRERDRVQSVLDREKDDDLRNQTERDRRVNNASRQIQFQSSDVRSIDISAIFEAMYAGGAGKTDWGKDILQSRAERQINLLQIIADNTTGDDV